MPCIWFTFGKSVRLRFDEVLKVAFRIIPESPRWLLAVGRKKEAVQILEKAASKNGTDKSLILRLVEQVEYDNEDSNKGNSGITALFKTPELRKRTILLLINW